MRDLRAPGPHGRGWFRRGQSPRRVKADGAVVDTISMSGESDTEALETALHSLLEKHPEALVTALGDDGFRIPMPSSLALAGDRTIPVPADRATMVDLVVPADRMVVITTWERARKTGMALGTVRMPSAAERLLSLTIIDARHPHGVWLGVLTDSEAATALSSPTALSSALCIPLRPRTATIRKNGLAIMTAVDDRATRMLGWTQDALAGLRSLDFIHPDDSERAVANWMAMLSDKEGGRVRYRHLCEDGSWLWVEVEHFYGDDDDEYENVVVEAQVSDISDEMAAHEELDRRERLFRQLAEALPTGVFQIDRDHRVVYANARLAAILGVEGAPTLAEQLEGVVSRDRAALDRAFDGILTDGVDRELEVRARLPETGDLRLCTVTLSALTDTDGRPGALVCMSDITESARLREELRVRATFDALTGCYNRASVLAALDAALTRDPRLLAVIFVDLDGFKPVNDQLGHAIGDEVLAQTARSIRGLLRDDDIVGRLGGDEFLVLCQRLDDSAQAMAIANRIAEALRQRVALSSGGLDLRASIGVAFSGEAETADVLVERADAAMYESKRQGHGRPVAFDDLALGN